MLKGRTGVGAVLTLVLAQVRGREGRRVGFSDGLGVVYDIVDVPTGFQRPRH